VPLHFGHGSVRRREGHEPRTRSRRCRSRTSS
jgi:hypothetical protein